MFSPLLRIVRRAVTIPALMLASLAPQAFAEDFAFHHENVMGTSMELRVKAEDAGAAARAEVAVLAEIDRLSAIFSGYDATSEFRRWMATEGEPVKVSPELFAVLERSEFWMEKGRGSFDPRVQALTDLWSKCARDNRLPTEAEQAGALTLMAARPWSLDREAKTATHLSRCPLSLNGIAKGYIVDRACEVPAEGVSGLMLNVGGDLCARGDLSSLIGIASPSHDSETTRPIARIEVKGRAVATSGNYQRGLKIGDAWYSHIFDSRDGRPVDRVTGATVVADRLIDADALAKVVTILPTDEALRLVDSLPGVECLLVAADGSISRSAGFHRLERPRVVTTSFRADGEAARKEESAKPDPKPKKSSGPAWDEAFELAVNFEISPPTGAARRYRRPYVAIWVEDEDGLAVRTLTLWVRSQAPGPRWIPDLKRWYQADQVRLLVDKTDLVETTSRATRPAGKYKAIWDGKDDRGKPLPQGKYSLFLEVAREHGTYQILRKDLTLADQPMSEDLEGNVELKSASVEYRKKGEGR